MNINKMKKEELELLSFTDIAYEVLKKEKENKTTVDLFKKVAELLELTEEEYSAKIADFYTSLTTDKRFHALEDGSWDLRERHSTKVVIDEDEDEYNEEIEEPDTKEEKEETAEDTDYDENEDYEEDDLEDLVVVNTDDESYDDE